MRKLLVGLVFSLVPFLAPAADIKSGFWQDENQAMTVTLTDEPCTSPAKRFFEAQWPFAVLRAHLHVRGAYVADLEACYSDTPMGVVLIDEQGGWPGAPVPDSAFQSPAFAPRSPGWKPLIGA